MNERIIELLEENQKLRNCIEEMENDLTLKDGIIRRQTVMLAQHQTIANDKNYIRDVLSERTLLEQLAEEAAELSQAALKLIRAAGYSNNPTPIIEQEAEANLEEELHDVLAVASLLGIINYDDDENPKWKRWAERLGKQHD